ncbi:uncharacterized protein LOC118194757 [Stegodyphus dumicola]|uniref:uncharacterized protein LOC118194757 n=1 Tax=Stegodyphus dumicola TaxID=202533 RepID=UPI0015AC7BF0|nr:uncharacterized protein LOC118194757 [Stegodyphus dumicola]
MSLGCGALPRLSITLTFCVGFLSFQNGVVHSEDLSKVKNSYRSITAHLHLLHQCRRQITFLASIALGAFITKVIKDSPLTPLPMPPVEEPVHWNLVKIPLHVPSHVVQWMPLPSTSMSINQGFKVKPPPWIYRRSLTVPEKQPNFLILRLQEQLTNLLKPSPILVGSAVRRTMRSLGSDVPQDASTRQWLMRWCH